MGRHVRAATGIQAADREAGAQLRGLYRHLPQIPAHLQRALPGAAGGRAAEAAPQPQAQVHMRTHTHTHTGAMLKRRQVSLKTVKYVVFWKALCDVTFV